MAKRSERARLPWLLALLLAAAPGLAAQTIDLKGWTPADTEAPREGVISQQDRILLGDLPLKRYIQVPRRFEGQDVQVHIYMFDPPAAGADGAGDPAAFSFFTFLQSDGAKPYEGQADCFIQERELVFWQGSRVVRSVFPDLRRAKLSVYLPWLREQFKEKVPLPEKFLRLPSADRIWPTRRLVVRDFQVRLLWPELPPGLFGLHPETPQANAPRSSGSALMVARYGDTRGEYWAGWVGGGAGPSGSTKDFMALDGRVVDPEQRTILRIRRCGPDNSLYLGPDRPDLGRILDRLDRSYRSDRIVEEIDPGRFFRRDNFTYSDLLLSGFKMVFLILAAAFVLGALAGLAIRGAKRALRRKMDLEDESVVRLGLDGLPVEGKKPETSRDESR
jgi:hypothetical protein